MLSGHRPFDKGKGVNVISKITSGEYDFRSPAWKRVTKESKDLVSKMLVVNPKKRINVKKALNHPWFGMIREIRLPSHAKKLAKLSNSLYNRLVAYK